MQLSQSKSILVLLGNSLLSSFFQDSLLKSMRVPPGIQQCRRKNMLSLLQIPGAALLGKSWALACLTKNMVGTAVGPTCGLPPQGRQSSAPQQLNPNEAAGRQALGKAWLLGPGKLGASVGLALKLTVGQSRQSRRRVKQRLQPLCASVPESAESASTSPEASPSVRPTEGGSGFPRHNAELPLEEGSGSSLSGSRSWEGRREQAVELEEEGSQPPYRLITAMALAGAAGTAYLTYEKLLGGPVLCPLGGACSEVLDSPWGTLFGLPLPLYGFVAYSTTALLAQLSRGAAGTGPVAPRWLLLGTTSVMAATSGYLMYILVTELEGISCAYCVASAVLSTALLVSTLRGFRRQELQGALAAQAGLAAAVVVGLSVAFTDARSAMAGTGIIDLPPIAPEVSTMSTSPGIALAKHLESVGAKMYGAFWCSHCFEQKQMFGREAMKYVEYVECYPEGYRQGVTIASACNEANIQGFPTWIIDGKAFPGEQDFEQLALASGFDTSTITK